MSFGADLRHPYNDVGQQYSHVTILGATFGGIGVRIVDCLAVEKIAHDLHHAPLSLLSLRSRIFRAASLPSCGGIVPAGAQT